MKTLLFFLLIFAGINCQAQNSEVIKLIGDLTRVTERMSSNVLQISLNQAEMVNIINRLDNRIGGLDQYKESVEKRISDLEKKVNILYSQHIEDSIKLRRIIECPDIHWIDDDIIDDFDNGFFPKIDSLNRSIPLNKL